jgi:hypothetical protein
MVSQSLCLGVGHPFGAHDQILLFLFFYRKIALVFVLIMNDRYMHCVYINMLMYVVKLCLVLF